MPIIPMDVEGKKKLANRKAESSSGALRTTTKTLLVISHFYDDDLEEGKRGFLFFRRGGGGEGFHRRHFGGEPSLKRWMVEFTQRRRLMDSTVDYSQVRQRHRGETETEKGRDRFKR